MQAFISMRVQHVTKRRHIPRQLAVVVGWNSRTARVWDPVAGTDTPVPLGNNDQVLGVHAGDGRLVVAFADGEVKRFALPDGRWDKMVYPIRDCEQFLKAIC